MDCWLGVVLVIKFRLQLVCDDFEHLVGAVSDRSVHEESTSVDEK